MDDRLMCAPVVRTFAALVRPVAEVRAFYVHGSLASGHFRPGISDLDLVAMLDREPGAGQQAALAELHQTFLGTHADAAGLHCAYVPCDQVTDVAREHLVWAHAELYRRPLSGIARAELLRFGITVYGPPPDRLLPAMDEAAVRAAARRELTGYWSEVVGKPEPWLQDVYVDYGLIGLARARETVATGRLPGKDEAIEALAELDVPPDLIENIRRRRRGEDVHLTPGERTRQARISRQIMRQGIEAMTADA